MEPRAVTPRAVAGARWGQDGPTPGEGSLTNWRELHLVYHGDRDHLLCELVHPLLRDLLTDGAIDRFYFIRYALGGPHIRLRWRCTHDPEALETRLERRANRFFERWPSPNQLDTATILETNRVLAEGDPEARSQTTRVWPVDSVQRRPLEIEIERYGGRQRIDHSLDLFTLSSLVTLRFLDQQPTAHSRRIGWAQWLIRLAAVMAVDTEGLKALLGYAPQLFGEDFDACVSDGDQAYERQAGAFQQLVRRELVHVGDPTDAEGTWLALARRVARQPGALRGDWYLAASHLHMTANRFGVENPEEVYLSRLLWRALGDLSLGDLARWRVAQCARDEEDVELEHRQLGAWLTAVGEGQR